MFASRYVRPGYPLHGSVDWGAARIQHLLEANEERDRRIAREDEPRRTTQQRSTRRLGDGHQIGTQAWGAQEILRLLEQKNRNIWHGRSSSQPDVSSLSQRRLADNQAPTFMHVEGTDWTAGGAAVGGALGGITGGIIGGIGGGAVCTPVAPGVGTLACGVGGAAEGAIIGSGIGAGLGAVVGSGIGTLTSNDEDELEEFCRQLYAGDTEVCNMIAKKRGKHKAAMCHASAAARYANCLRGLPLPPLVTWNN